MPPANVPRLSILFDCDVGHPSRVCAMVASRALSSKAACSRRRISACPSTRPAVIGCNHWGMGLFTVSIIQFQRHNKGSLSRQILKKAQRSRMVVGIGEIANATFTPGCNSHFEQGRGKTLICPRTKFSTPRALKPLKRLKTHIPSVAPTKVGC